MWEILQVLKPSVEVYTMKPTVYSRGIAIRRSERQISGKHFQV
jgi:hypothetical protein